MTEQEAMKELYRLYVSFYDVQETLEKMLEEEKEQYQIAVLDVINSCDNQKIKQRIARGIYFLDKNINVNMINHLAMHQKTSFIFDPWGVEVQWKKCKHKTVHYAKSRLDMKYDKYGSGSLNMKKLRYCPECKKIDNGKRDKEIVEDRKELKQLKNMPYNEYLQTDHWRHVRHRALMLAQFLCQLCGTNENLHVHHKTYKRRGNEYWNDLVVLCSNCHAKFHDKLPE